MSVDWSQGFMHPQRVRPGDSVQVNVTVQGDIYKQIITRVERHTYRSESVFLRELADWLDEQREVAMAAVTVAPMPDEPVRPPDQPQMGGMGGRMPFDHGPR